MNKAKKSAVAAGLTLGLLGGGGAGLVLGATGVSGAQDAPATTEAPAQAPADDARPDRGDRLAEVLAPLVADGTINQAQADAVTAALLDARPDHGPRDRGPRGGAAAEALDMTVEELRDAVKDGQTIAQVAEARGVDVQVVIDAMIAHATERIDDAVEAGRLSQEQADERLAELSERITDAVNNGRPDRPDSAPGPDGD